MPIVHHRRPSLLSYPRWFGARVFLKPALALWPVNKVGLAGLFLIDRLVAVGPKPRGVVREQLVLANRPAELIMPVGPSRRDSDTAILYLHGGAFVVCGLGTHRSIAARLASACETPVFSLEYRQLPNAGVGTSVADALDAYAELIDERGYRRVVVAGDSAGGFLAAKVVEAVAARGLPKPPALIGFSPLLDLDLGTNPDRSSRSDAYLPKSKMARLAPQFDKGPVPLTGVRRIADADLTDFPPTVMVTAEGEMLEPDVIDLIESLDQAGVEAFAHSYAWQVHAFPVLSSRHQETLQAVEVTAAFAKRVIREGKTADQREDQWAG
ncbi:alpha/beta hydrolase [Gordonia sp. zg691]|uniref:Alpha/beta hydrolase n=1 Tax=Gordonia jinghuaiqii TaxID=2758710 RepID=A0A7D7LR28_9ACTN|nr:alpha/beta hydrolase [Gordonia jinghuaiqii]MBD0860458.1 alpha/beta hydrolase [Gordonia jinghuaiqii]MCR5978272.1 alpha/beta hydrolase fold domain-containing protein [Gordonia jinghuaiqii]QMT01283.1 alpha/beta hydrolase [Gordonia jinghuaiqii]